MMQKLSMCWPMFVVAVLAAIIASQAMISATFSIIQQSLSLGCFPRVKIVHTSAKYEGQVYIPEINYLLMLACVGVTLVWNNVFRGKYYYELGCTDTPFLALCPRPTRVGHRNGDDAPNSGVRRCPFSFSFFRFPDTAPTQFRRLRHATSEKKKKIADFDRNLPMPLIL